MSRVLRALVYAIFVLAVYHATLLISAQQHSPAVVVLTSIGHARGCSLALAAGCIATGEVWLLAVILVIGLLTTWPVDLVALVLALASGGLVGAGIRAVVQGRTQHLSKGDA